MSTCKPDDSSTPRHPGGRPTTYTPEIADRICGEIAEGKSLRTICKPDDMPALSTVFLWRRVHQEFSDRYEKAKQDCADAMAEDILAIADDSSMDWAERVDKDGNKYYAIDKDNIQRSRLQVDARKWIAAKLKPNRYGDKVELSGDKNAPVSIQIVKFSDD